jgi:hypothetical protein
MGDFEGYKAKLAVQLRRYIIPPWRSHLFASPPDVVGHTRESWEPVHNATEQFYAALLPVVTADVFNKYVRGNRNHPHPIPTLLLWLCCCVPPSSANAMTRCLLLSLGDRGTWTYLTVGGSNNDWRLMAWRWEYNNQKVHFLLPHRVGGGAKLNACVGGTSLVFRGSVLSTTATQRARAQ